MTALRAVEAKIQELQYNIPDRDGAFLEHLVTGKLFFKISFNAIVNSSIRILSAVPSMIYDLACGILFLDTSHLKDAVLTIPKAVVHLTKDAISLGICLGISIFIIANVVKVIAFGCAVGLPMIIVGGAGFLVFKGCELIYNA